MIWDQQENESDRDYYLFSLYRDSNYRQMREFGRHLYEIQDELEYELPPSLNTIQRIASVKKWRKRVQAYDDYRYLATHAEILKIDTEHKREEYEELYKISKDMREKITSFLNDFCGTSISGQDSTTLKNLVSSLRTIFDMRRLISEQSTENVSTNLNADISTDEKVTIESIFERVDKELEYDNK